MSMLAESRSRQKWSHDPRNTNWANDKSKFGYTMLSKMGWSEGKGLGANLTGATSHIKVNKRGSNAGIGLKKSHEDDWIGHQDDFNALLSSLNGKPAAETASPAEKMSKMSKHRYTKFVKSKDLSNASTDDLACIFGVRGKSAAGVENAKNCSEDSSESESASEEEEVEGGMKTIESTLNVNEYFAKKMAALKQKNALGNNSPICLSNIKNEAVKIEETDDKQCAQETFDTPEPETKKKKKKKSKEVEAESCIEAVCEEAVTESGDGDGAKKKKKKKKTKESTNGEIEVPSPETSPPTTALEDVTSEVVKKKKKKKKNKENIEVETTTPVVDVVLENGLVTKKKRKRTADDSEQNVTDTDPVVKKKKKKKSKEVSDAE